jgi:DNA-binding beta-propeller fold protein YncE
VLPSRSAVRYLTRIPIGEKSKPASAAPALILEARKQAYAAEPEASSDDFDPAINSPKSATFSADGSKFYIHSLEGCATVVYDARTRAKLTTISHSFGPDTEPLFKDGESTLFDYKFPAMISQPNHFVGKPVESCLSHDGRYLWVTYYRRSFDTNAEHPSALCIIDTSTDKIIRVMPAGPLPKMIACSPDNKWIAVTHWGDNTVGIIDISSGNPADFRYVEHLVIDSRLQPKFGGQPVNRDKNCGCCLRGTVFTPDSKYLLVGKMGGSGGLAVFSTQGFKPLGSVVGMFNNIRHLSIHGDYLYLSTNASGYVQKCRLSSLIDRRLKRSEPAIEFTDWRNTFVGAGARTIALAPDGKHLFVAVNNLSQVGIVRTSDMKMLGAIRADSFPVGMAISPAGDQLLVTSQGVANTGGNSVMIFKVLPEAR